MHPNGTTRARQMPILSLLSFLASPILDQSNLKSPKTGLVSWRPKKTKTAEASEYSEATEIALQQLFAVKNLYRGKS